MKNRYKISFKANYTGRVINDNDSSCGFSISKFANSLKEARSTATDMKKEYWSHCGYCQIDIVKKVNDNNEVEFIYSKRYGKMF